ncbi:MAG: hypothetical protein JWQ40_1796, partial [Segetibacter sp.]|nr:hypothetical protein [Segetibacter sp.]
TGALFFYQYPAASRIHLPHFLTGKKEVAFSKNNNDWGQMEERSKLKRFFES